MNNQTAEERAFTLLSQVIMTPVGELIEAFDHLDQYNVYTQGKRTIEEPHEALKKVQKRLLSRLFYKLNRREEFYRQHPHSRERVYFSDALSHAISWRVNGMMPGKSSRRAVSAHCSGDNQFITTLDFKGAFSSVKAEHIRGFLHKIFLDDCMAAFLTYKRRLVRGKRLRGLLAEAKESVGLPPRNYDPWLKEKGISDVVQSHEFEDWMETVIPYNFITSEPIRRKSYPKYSSFPKNLCPEFRKHICELAQKNLAFEDTDLPEIVERFTDYVCQLCCRNGALPQGAPTSGFLLNIAVSETNLMMKLQCVEGVRAVTIFVDDIIVSTRAKPTDDFKARLIGIIEGTGIFVHNPKKLHVYDLRKGSAHVLGMRIARMPATEQEIAWFYEYADSGMMPNGLREAVKNGRPWQVAHMTLSQKKQKWYRSFFHRVVSSDASESDIAKAVGYYGHLKSVYGSSLPSALVKPVSEFRSKFLQNE